MSIRSHTCWDLAVSLAATHAEGHEVGASPIDRDIFQVSTMSALVAGNYDGDTPYAEVVKHGDFGVGTFNALDGEMAAVDGDFYHLHPDGSVTEIDPDELTPFAAVTFFATDAEIDVDLPHCRTQLLALVDATVPSTSSFYALRIDGVFSAVTTRTATRQSRPYPRLVAATGSQIEQTLTDVRGTMVGFRAPEYAQGVTVAGYHLHFIDDTRTVGGHVLDFTLATGAVAIDKNSALHVEMPTTAPASAPRTEGSDKDLAAEIVRSEFGR